MRLKLVRKYLKEDYTIGKLYVDGYYICDTLEDKYRDLSKENKIPGKTAIPYGIYEVILTMSARFKRIMPQVLAVPHFVGIRIHAGNTAENTEGCILVGKNKIKGKLVDSRFYCNMLMSLLKNAVIAREKIMLEIV